MNSTYLQKIITDAEAQLPHNIIIVCQEAHLYLNVSDCKDMVFHTV